MVLIDAVHEYVDTSIHYTGQPYGQVVFSTPFIGPNQQIRLVYPLFGCSYDDFGPFRYFINL